MSDNKVSFINEILVGIHYAKLGPVAQLAHLPYEPYYGFLFYLTRILEPKIIVECGVYKGYSLGYLTVGSNNGSTIIGVDLELQELPKVLDHPKVGLIYMDSVSYLNQYPGPKNIDLLHLDTIHTPEHVNQELEAALPHMAPNGLICIDDIFISDEMRQWWNELEYTKIELPELHITGYGVIVCD